MKITREVFRESLNKFLSTLEYQGIRSLDDVKKVVGRKFDFPGPLEEYVSIEEWPHDYKTTTYTISYNKIGIGTPVELAINAQIDHSQIIIKTFYHVQGYERFAEDDSGNVAKTRLFAHCADLIILLQELERLKSE